MNRIVGAERDALILSVLQQIETAKPHADADAWERGWLQALENFRANPCEESLVPAFIRRERPVRWMGDFWTGMDELEYASDTQAWIAEELKGCKDVWEFGCGTGFNLAALARLMSSKLFVGLDRSQHAVDLVREFANHKELPIISFVFDMLDPSGAAPMMGKAGVFTFGAMEQLGNFRPFIEYLLAQRPQKVVHVEPIPELLDPANLIDWLSLKFHEKRGYTVGLLPYLREHPGVEVLHVERSYFGSLMLESYARIVWRPR